MNKIFSSVLLIISVACINKINANLNSLWDNLWDKICSNVKECFAKNLSIDDIALKVWEPCITDDQYVEGRDNSSRECAQGYRNKCLKGRLIEAIEKQNWKLILELIQSNDKCRSSVFSALTAKDSKYKKCTEQAIFC
jgi:hypothetical protein